jgi:hypothetical protein
MSTKTTFKRIALVTVAALGFGVMSVAPSSAAISGLTSTLSATTTTVDLGVAAKVTQTVGGLFNLNSDTATTTVALTSWPAGATNASLASMVTVTPTAVDTATANTATTSNGQVEQTTGGVVGPNTSTYPYLGSGRTSWSVTPNAATATAGTYVYTFTTAVTGNTSIVSTWTVVVAAPVLLASEAFIAMGTTAPTADGTTLSSTITTGTPGETAVATINVRQWADAAKTIALNAGFTSAVEVSVTGAGAVGVTSSTSAVRGPVAATAAKGTSDQTYYLYNDGRTGTATITIKVGTTTLPVKTYKFVGSLASMSVTASNKNIGVGSTNATLTVAGADVNGNATATPTLTAATSSDATVATVTFSGAVATVTGVKAGTSTITLTAGTVSTTSVVTVLPVTAPKLAWAFDKDAYEAGEKMTLTITAAGIADGARAVFASVPSTNFTLSGAAPTFTATPTFAAGVSTLVMYAPATSGKFVLSATVGLAIDTEIALNTAGTTTRTPVELTATITNPALDAAQEATDAALEAIDAGIAAKDAADQAVEAADAATIAAQDAAAAAELAGEVAVAAAEAAGEIATEALDAANAATEAALSAAEAADAATEAATEAKEAAEAATTAVAALSAEVTKLMAALTAKVTTLSTLVAKIAKKVKA